MPDAAEKADTSIHGIDRLGTIFVVRSIGAGRGRSGFFWSRSQIEHFKKSNQACKTLVTHKWRMVNTLKKE